VICSMLKTSASHVFNYSSVRLMGREAKEHLARLGLKENLNTLSGSILPIPHLSQGFEYLVRQAQAMPRGYDTKT
jgi:hypothetical protein